MTTIKPEAVLLFYDYPQVFIGRDIVDQRYACMVIKENRLAPEYLCVPISEKRKSRLSNGKVDLRTVFSQPELKEFYVSSLAESEESISVEKAPFEKCPEELLPSENIFFDDYDEVANEAIEQKSPIAHISLQVAEANDSARIKSQTLSEFISTYQNSVKHLVKFICRSRKESLNKGETPYSLDIFGFSYGSFTVKLRSSYEGDLLGDNKLLSQALFKLSHFLELANDHEKALDFLQEMKGHSAGSLIKLMEFMVDNSCPIEHIWAHPDMGKSHTVSIKTETIKDLVDICRQRSDLFTETVRMRGIFTSANSDNNTWRVVDDEGNYYSGKIHEDSNITMSGIVIRKQKYSIVCEEKIELTMGTSRETKTLYMREIKKI